MAQAPVVEPVVAQVGLCNAAAAVGAGEMAASAESVRLSSP